MSLAGAAAVALGGAIAKGILKLWLKDHAVGAMVGAGLVDLLKSKTKDLLAREKGEVHFRAIGLKVAESLLPVFEDEGAGIDEGGLTAVALAVAGTLEKTPITNEILAARKIFDTIYIDENLQDYIINLVSATRFPKDYGLESLAPMIQFGASPRASIFFNRLSKAYAFMQGRGYVVPHDIKSLGMDILRHRVLLTYEAEAENITSEEVLKKIFDTVEVP